jgi:hypothetical protein
MPFSNNRQNILPDIILPDIMAYVTAGNCFSHLFYTGNAYHDITTTGFEEDYNTSCMVVA